MIAQSFLLPISPILFYLFFRSFLHNSSIVQVSLQNPESFFYYNILPEFTFLSILLSFQIYFTTLFLSFFIFVFYFISTHFLLLFCCQLYFLSQIHVVIVIVCHSLVHCHVVIIILFLVSFSLHFCCH